MLDLASGRRVTALTHRATFAVQGDRHVQNAEAFAIEVAERQGRVQLRKLAIMNSLTLTRAHRKDTGKLPPILEVVVRQDLPLKSLAVRVPLLVEVELAIRRRETAKAAQAA